MSRQPPKGRSRPLSRVSIGYCHPDRVSSFFHGSLISLLRYSYDVVADVIGVLSGPKVDSARNSIVHTFLEGKGTHLLMVDTDMVLPTNTIDRLLKADKDIIGGLCFVGGFQGSHIQPYMRIIEEVEGKPLLRPLWEYPPNAKVQVMAIGAACMLVKREVFEEILQARGEDHPLPWFAHGIHNGVQIGEDIAFCLTAGKVGFETWVDTGLVVPHVKPRFLDEQAYTESLSEETHPRYSERREVPAYIGREDGYSSHHDH